MMRCKPLALVLVGLAAGPALAADGVAPVLVSKSITASTVALIDPESGTSSGTAGADTKIAVGDVISFRFKYFPVPSKILRGIAGYLTEWVPPGTEVVGARFIDANGDTIFPNYPGVTSTPAIARSYAETGLFYATTVSRTPNDQFLTLLNGLTMTPAPSAASGIVGPLIGATAPFKAHDTWDRDQVTALGNVAGAAPVNFGSAVAGPDTFYQFQGASGTTVGPWSRIAYPGSTGGSATLTPAATGAFRAITSTPTGFDLRPNNPLAATAVRYAGGEMRTGVPVEAEVFLRVKAGGIPLEPAMNKDVDCAEAFGGDTSGRNPPAWNTGAADNVWNFYVPSPACVFLNLLFELAVDKTLALGSGTLNYTIHGRNLSTAVAGQHAVVATLQYPTNLTVSGTGTTAGFTTRLNCATGYNCLDWAIGDIAPSFDYTRTARFTYTGGNGLDNLTTFARYTSTELPGGFVTQAQTMVTGIFVQDATLSSPSTGVAANTTVNVTGTLVNSGTNAGKIDTYTVVLPAGWTISGDATINGTGETCDKDPLTGDNASTCGTNRVVFDGLGLDLTPGQSVNVSFNVLVPTGATAGLYPIDVSTISSQTSYGGSPETYFRNVSVIPVIQNRAATPVLSCNLNPSVPVSTFASTITGTCAGEVGSTINLYFNGILRATGTCAAGGTFSIASPTGSFGAMYPGLEIKATADGASTLESFLSTKCLVSPATGCTDGVDNDGDGKCDFAGCYNSSNVFLPPDPGCTSAADPDETDLQCSDGKDNDSDNTCDYAGCTIASVTYPPDPQCWAPWDNTENSSSDTPGGRPACMDGIDNDDDGFCDFNGCVTGTMSLPADPGCNSPNDTNETPPALADTKTRLLFIVDTSGSMNWNTCADNTFPGGDGTVECTGNAVACGTCNATNCSNATADDTRLFKVKAGLANVISAFGEVTYGLMRFKQTPTDFSCPITNATFPSGGWQGSSAVPNSLATDPNRCGSYNSGELLSRFAVDNAGPIMQWLDGQSNFGATPAPSLDIELRGSGTTPLAGSLKSAYDYLMDPVTGVRIAANDPILACRPYGVVLLTDGVETCGGDPNARAAQLWNAGAGVPVYVIGFAISSQADKDRLNAIALAGGTTTALFVDDSAALSTAIAGIVQKSVKVEICNGADDNCNNRIDEGFGRWEECVAGSDCRSGTCDQGRCVCANNGECSSGFACGALGTATQYCLPTCTAGSATCQRTGVKKGCAGGCFENDGFNELLSTPLTSTTPVETCNGLDDNCDGIIDNCGNNTPRSCCPTCPPCAVGGPFPETCDNCDNDCNGTIDDNLNDIGLPCGVTVGVCEAGTTECDTGVLSCTGGTAGSTEVCDGVDNDCNGRTDEVTRVCFPTDASFPGATPGEGRCVAGRQACAGCGSATAPCSSVDAQWGTCTGFVGPITETCNNVDDDCDGVVDDNAPVANQGQACCPSGLNCSNTGGSTRCTTGTFQCVNGGRACVDAVAHELEVCDGVDNDCNGVVDDVPGVSGSCTDDDTDPNNTTTINIKGQCRATYACVTNVTGQGPRGLTCVQTVGPGTEECNGLDDDCDGVADNDVVVTENVCLGLQQSDLDVLVAAGYAQAELDKVNLATPPCNPGHTECIGGALTCIGRLGPQPNVCNGVSNDCTGETNTNGTCPEGFECFQGNCVTPCGTGEFPCPGGFVCDPNTKLCVPDGCDTLMCPAGFLCQYDADQGTSVCVDPCEGVTCPGGFKCQLGVCLDDSCLKFGCPDGQICTGTPPECVADPCEGVVCMTNEFCQNGTCVSSCTEGCMTGEICQDGNCIPDPCKSKVCLAGQACAVQDGVAVCVDDRCGIECATGTVCCGGSCVQDPCRTVTCASGSKCQVESTCAANCVEDGTHGGETFIVGAGGGGANCSTAGDGAPFTALMMLLALLTFRRLAPARVRRKR